MRDTPSRIFRFELYLVRLEFYFKPVMSRSRTGGDLEVVDESLALMVEILDKVYSSSGL